MLDTIVGLATAAGEGGIAIVRISGTDAIALFEKAFRPAKSVAPFASHHLMYGHAVDANGEMLDEAMGVVMRAPNSYTREDVCEIHTHGGEAAASQVLMTLTKLGARVAQPGEFTRRAFMNGRIDLAQAEAVMGIISAHSQAALRAEERMLAGGQSRFLREVQDGLTGLLAGLEAHIDYPDEIDEDEALTGLEQGLHALIDQLASAVDERSARILREGLHVALCGCPNAGKSTLFNALLREERAIVTDIPGTTRDVLEGSFALGDQRVFLKDTAGLRESDDQVERIGVERARAAIDQADCALILIDGSKPLTEEEIKLLSSPAHTECAVLLTKRDMGDAIQIGDLQALTSCTNILPVSAKDGSGMDALRTYLKTLVTLPQQELLTHERHLSVAREVLDHLEHAKEGLARGDLLDLAAVDLHEALYLLGRITGESVDEKLLDDIFSRFCVGK